MFIGLCGGICAGKASIASYLVEVHNFKRIRLARTAKKSATNLHVPSVDPGADDTQHTFTDIDSLLDFVTLRWKEAWVTTDIWDHADVDALLRRPFFLLVSVDAPVNVRWQRFKGQCAATQLPPPTLEEFVLRNDEHLFAPGTGLSALFQRAQIKLLNSTASITALRDAISSLNLMDEARLRPSWDQYFMQLADLAARRSNCMKRRVGCCVVREMRVVSTGYNGTPRGMKNCNDGGCPRCNNAARGGVSLSTCLCLHAEENALLEAGRDRIGKETTLYCNTCPCLTCSVKITQVGISEVVYNQGYVVDTETAKIFADGGVTLRQFSPPTDGLVDLSLCVESDTKELKVRPAIREPLNEDSLIRSLS
ncbi:hypothetical protein EJ02DRAFT_399590 [Clathrospora elynae]|uniref:Deoxycytidylate deaminase n=1 Tax=Clathrospora elynae TaxID=706981 RepID=A0A6A5STE5_9PLEO|nr:hypothetical protein EJ02DRAFT_399590 [Clathrospora elynae]